MTFMAFRLFQLVILCKPQSTACHRKNETNGILGKVPPGRGTNGPKNGTPRQKRDVWQPYLESVSVFSCLFGIRYRRFKII